MQVIQVTANVRYSAQVKDGRFKTVELGAEAQVDPTEDWQQAQADLYHDLAGQLRALWNGSANGQDATQKGRQTRQEGQEGSSGGEGDQAASPQENGRSGASPLRERLGVEDAPGLQVEPTAPAGVGTPTCPRHKKARQGKDGSWYCPTPVSRRKGQAAVWCDWRWPPKS